MTAMPLMVALALAAFAGFGSAAYQMLSERVDLRRNPAPGRFVAVRGRRLYVQAEGEGGPTTVILPGMTDNGLG
ncbi:hypothetical protein ACFWYW_56060 [Nonomuraea sp. NPDC059023]|uniref:hypothetical protein n=1 Tax=unclassified Nonomuraea TaxID=2593643 RepID=UPI0036B9169C